MNKLDAHRELACNIFRENFRTAMHRDYTVKQNAGTALLLATSTVSAAAEMLAMTDPSMANAPIHAKIDALLDLLRETLVEHPKAKPSLKEVKDQKGTMR